MASAKSYKPTDISYYTIPTFKFASGVQISDLRVAYKSINPSSKKGTILIPTCYIGLINETLDFSTSPNDCLSSYHVVVVAMLGSGESSSPSNHPAFPSPGDLRYEDCVKSQYVLLTEHLGITSLESIVGFSMGGQQAYHWAVMFPNFVKKVVPICSSARTSPHNYAFIEGPIASLTNSVDYILWRKDPEAEKPVRGVRAFARAYSAWLTSSTWFREKWYGTREGGLGFKSVEEYIVKGGEDGYDGWDAQDIMVTGRMWQMGDIGTVIPGKETLSPLGGGVGDDELFKEALGSIKAKVLVMPCRTDQYFPPEDSEIEMKYLERAEFAPIESVWGHGAGGGMHKEDIKWMNGRIREFMEKDAQ